MKVTETFRRWNRQPYTLAAQYEGQDRVTFELHAEKVSIDASGAKGVPFDEVVQSIDVDLDELRRFIDACVAARP